MQIDFIGHAAILIQAGGLRILSDPWWEGACFGSQWWPYPRFAVDVVRRAPVDYIYISHGHADHLHPGTLRRLPKKGEMPRLHGTRYRGGAARHGVRDARAAPRRDP